MKAVLLTSVRPEFFDSSGNPLNAGNVYFYVPNTTTFKDTYTTEAQSVVNPNPVTLNSRGEFHNSGTPIDVYLNGAYDIVVKDSSGNTIYEVDDFTLAGALAAVTTTKTGNYTVTGDDEGKLILCDTTGGSITITLLASATAGNGFKLGIKKTDSSTNIVIIDGNSTELIDLNQTYNLSYQGDVIWIVSDGTNWKITHRDELVKKDVNNNIITRFNFVASAVNYLEDKNAATTNAPSLSAIGNDANVGLDLITQGTGTVTAKLTDTRTNTVAFPLTVQGGTSGTPAANIGTGITFNTPNDAGTMKGALLSTRLTTVTAGAEYADALLSLYVNGTQRDYFGWSTDVGSTFTATFRQKFPSNNSLYMDPVSAAVISTAGTSIATATVTKVHMNIESIDNYSYWDSSATSRFTPLVPGYYIVSASSSYSSTDVKTITTLIYKNGATVRQSSTYAPAGAADTTAVTSTVILCNGTTDYIEVFTLHNAGVNQTLSINGNCWVTIHHIPSA